MDKVTASMTDGNRCKSYERTKQKCQRSSTTVAEMKNAFDELSVDWTQVRKKNL